MDIRAYSTTAASNTADFPEGMAPSAVNDEARELQAEIAQLLVDQSGTLTTAGTSTAYTLTLSTTPASLADGLAFSFTCDEKNTGASTLVVTPSGASAFASKKIRKFTRGGEADLSAGDMVANGHYQLQYDSAADGGTGAYILLNPAQTTAAFRAHKNGTDQTGIVSGAVTKVTFGTEALDIGSHYDTTNSRWTPPAGPVEIGATFCLASGLADGANIRAYIYKNGVELVYRMYALSGTGTAQTASVEVVDNASGTDYYEAYFFAATGVSTGLAGASTVTWFEGKAL